jgi:hypothetical protein
MTQPPFRPPDGNPMLRFSLFVVAFIVIVAIGSQSRHVSASSEKSICVCIPSRAGLLLKSVVAKTQARSTALLSIRAAVTK